MQHKNIPMFPHIQSGKSKRDFWAFLQNIEKNSTLITQQLVPRVRASFVIYTQRMLAFHMNKNEQLEFQFICNVWNGRLKKFLKCLGIFDEKRVLIVLNFLHGFALYCSRILHFILKQRNKDFLIFSEVGQQWELFFRFLAAIFTEVKTVIIFILKCSQI